MLAPAITIFALLGVARLGEGAMSKDMWEHHGCVAINDIHAEYTMKLPLAKSQVSDCRTACRSFTFAAVVQGSCHCSNTRWDAATADEHFCSGSEADGAKFAHMYILARSVPVAPVPSDAYGERPAPPCDLPALTSSTCHGFPEIPDLTPTGPPPTLIPLPPTLLPLPPTLLPLPPTPPALPPTLPPLPPWGLPSPISSDDLIGAGASTTETAAAVGGYGPESSQGELPCSYVTSTTTATATTTLVVSVIPASGTTPSATTSSSYTTTVSLTLYPLTPVPIPAPTEPSVVVSDVLVLSSVTVSTYQPTTTIEAGSDVGVGESVSGVEDVPSPTVEEPSTFTGGGARQSMSLVGVVLCAAVVASMLVQ